MSNRGAFVQSIHNKTIQREGTPITVAGRTTGAVQKSLERKDREFLPEGATNNSFNAADADWCAFVVSPLAFNNSSPITGEELLGDAAPETAWPTPGQTFAWHGVGYTVSAVRPVDAQSVPVALRLIAYRTPPKGSDSADPVTGKRADYVPPDSTL